jgi:hypothetical protein
MVSPGEIARRSCDLNLSLLSVCVVYLIIYARFFTTKIAMSKHYRKTNLTVNNLDQLSNVIKAVIRVYWSYFVYPAKALRKFSREEYNITRNC